MLQKFPIIKYLLFIFLLFFISSCVKNNELDNRIGFGLAAKADEKYWSEKLGTQWYFDWGTLESPKKRDLEYWQTIRVHQGGYSPSSEKIISIAKHYPGYTWIIGNEPDNIYQDNTTPERYAHIYHELYTKIKSNDPTAKIAIAGVSQPTPARILYLETVLATYEQSYGKKMPIDWWNIHAYVLREEKDSWGADLPVGINLEHGELYEIDQHGNLEIFKNNLITFRKWIKDQGYQNTPLVITEFGILIPEDFGYSLDFISDYLNATCEWLLFYQDIEIGYPADDYRLIQKFAWFSLSDPTFVSSSLANFEQNSLTPVGESFKLFTEQNKGTITKIP